MLASGVDAVPTAEAIHAAQHIVSSACGDVVKVEGKNIAPVDGVTFAPATSMDDTAHKAADIFQIVLLGLGHTQISGQCFGAAHWYGKFVV